MMHVMSCDVLGTGRSWASSRKSASMRSKKYSLSHLRKACVTFGLNVQLDLSGEAATKSLSSLCAELLFEVLGESTWTMAIRVIRGDEGVGDFPGVRGGFRGV